MNSALSQSVHVDVIRCVPTRDGSLDVHYRCGVSSQEGPEDEELAVEVVFVRGEVEDVLYRGSISRATPFENSVRVNPDDLSHGRIFVYAVGDQHNAAVRPVSLSPSSESEAPRQAEHLKSAQKPNFKVNVPRKRLGPSAPPRVVGSRSSARAPVPRFPVKVLEPVKKGPTRPLRSSWFGKTWVQATAAVALSLTGGGAFTVKKIYDGGVEDAALVRQEMKWIPMIPLLDRDENGSTRVLSYLSSKPFIHPAVKDWNEHTQMSFKDGETQEDNVQDLRPVLVTDVQKGGPLYLARRALTMREDKDAEEGKGISLHSVLRPIVSLGHAGGSTIDAQLCSAVWDQTGQFDSTEHLSRVWGGINPARAERKIRKEACGAGLGMGEKITVDEMFANYMTFVYYYNQFGVVNFVRKYWGIKDFKDPEFTKGMQILLSALPSRHPKVKSSHTLQEKTRILTEHWEENIVPVAEQVLMQLKESGEVSDSEYSSILEEIHAAKPDFERVASNFSKSESSPYAYVGALATHELRARFKGKEEEAQEWRASVDGVTVAIQGSLQEALPEIVKSTLAGLSPNARATSFVVDDEGNYLGIFTGSSQGFDHQSGAYAARRLETATGVGSLGKLLVASSLAGQGYSPDSDDPLVIAAASDLACSSKDLIDDAKALGVSPSELKREIACFGSLNEPLADPLKAAVEGGWSSSPKQVASLMEAILTGKALPEPHLITGEMKGEQFVPLQFNSNTTQACATLLYHGGKVRPWAELPISGYHSPHGAVVLGTMRAIHRPSSARWVIGKTGTANADINGDGSADGLTTSTMWAPVAEETSKGRHYIVVTMIQGERLDERGSGVAFDVSVDLGAHLEASMAAVPLSDRVLQQLNTLK